jgi:acetyl-CoA acyltransferase
LRPGHFFPRTPEVKERSTGKTMGEHAEMMAKIHGITREAQDDFAFESHRKAGEGIKDGRLPKEIIPVYLPPRFETRVDTDNCVRVPPDRASMNIDRRYGSVTAANSSPLTDGGSAVVLMSESKVKADGRPVKGWIKSFAYSALDPHPELLLGPAYAVPLALQRAGLTVDMHEAFAAQVLCVLKVMKENGTGEVNPATLNVLGGSIALGHPFGATGTRMIVQTLNELERRKGRYALLSLCAAGGMAAAMVLEK